MANPKSGLPNYCVLIDNYCLLIDSAPRPDLALPEQTLNWAVGQSVRPALAADPGTCLRNEDEGHPSCHPGGEPPTNIQETNLLGSLARLVRF